MDPFLHFQDDPESWKTGRQLNMPSAAMLSYYLGGLKGPAMSIDTAP